MLLPKWRDIGFTGELYELPYILENNDYKLLKNLQSKFYWYEIFTKYNICTPKVYFYNKIQLCDLPDDEIFIKKPVYGTQGFGIEKVTMDEYMKSTDSHDVILQEFLENCEKDKEGVKSSRILTLSENDIVVAYSMYVANQTKNDIRSNLVHGNKMTLCNVHNCHGYNELENITLNKTIQKLITLHTNELINIPIIGWDVILTCDCAYVFEGNMCPGKNSEELKNKLINIHHKNINICK